MHFMKTSLTHALCGLAAVLMLAGCQSTDRHTGSSALELFNGKDLRGWKHVLADAQVKPDQVWSVQDGLLICKGAPVGYLYSDQSFTNFRLVVEYRWAPGQKPGNSGIFTRIHQKFATIPRCSETQLMHGSAGDLLTLQGMKLQADQPRYFFVAKHELAGDICGVKKLLDAERPAGEWNRVEILAQGPAYTVWVNGQKVNEALGVDVVSGLVGLQSEGGEIHFRRATLTPMP